MNITVKPFIDFAIQALSILAPLLPTDLDSRLLKLLEIVRDTPALMAWIQEQADALIPGGTAPPPSPPVFSIEHIPEEVLQSVRPRAELFGGIGELAKWLPVLIQLYRAWKEATK